MKKEFNAGINFNLSDLDQVISSAEEMVSYSEDSSIESIKKAKMNNFTRIVKGVARKYESKWVDREDLEQDLWVRILELIDDCGGIEHTDEKLVASVAYKKAVDVYRYRRLRYESNVQFIDKFSSEEDNPNYNPGGRSYDSDKIAYPTIDRDEDVVLYKEIVNIFSKDSRERKYILIKLVNHGVLDREYLDEDDNLLAEIPDGDTEADILRLLGYKSRCPGSWTVAKRSMRQAIQEFLKS